MADVHSKSTRSYNMSRIKSKDTKPEMKVRSYLHRRGLRYTLHNKSLPGKPDLVFKKHKAVVFVNGCFWHGHQNCKYFKIPKTRSDWWREKLNKNIERDQNNISQLETLGWTVETIWECQLKKELIDETLRNLYYRITT